MRILILSCNTGEGHNSCAAAVHEFFEKRGHLCDTVDVLGFVSKKFSGFISKWHARIYRHMPKLFAEGYDFAERHDEIFDENTPVYKMLTGGTERLNNYIESRGYDIILCTHVFSSLILTDIKNSYGTKAKTGFIATDYTCSPSTADSDLDHYCIPDESLRDEFVKKGIPSKKITATGIPVRSCFLEKRDKTEAKRRLHIPAEHDHVLIMCGSMGCGPISKLTRNLSERMPEDVEITVICGTNKRLCRQMSFRFRNNKRVHVLGFVEKVDELMDSADLYITKPGGLSITEAAHKALPMAFMNVVNGCEVYNMKYFVDKCFAVCAKACDSIENICVDMLTDGKKLADIAFRLGQGFSQDPMNKIYEIFTGDSEYDKEKI